MVPVGDAAALAPLPLPALELLPQAASSAGTLSAAPAPSVPLSIDRRPSDVAEVDGGTRRARYSASDWGRDMVPPLAQREWMSEQKRTRPLTMQHTLSGRSRPCQGLFRCRDPT